MRLIFSWKTRFLPRKDIISWGSFVDKKKGIWADCFYGSGVGQEVVNMPSSGMCLPASLGRFFKDWMSSSQCPSLCVLT